MRLAFPFVALVFALALGVQIGISSARAQDPHLSAEEILRSFTRDFRADREAAHALTFGVRIAGQGGGEWHVVVTGEEDDDGHEVMLVEGPSSRPTFVYVMDLATLRAIDEGRLNVLTAQGKALASDEAPLEIERTPGWAPDERLRDLNPFSFHFWTRGFPEKVPFSKEVSRVVHGNDNVVFFYRSGLRSAWTSIAKGPRPADGADALLAAPFYTMIVGIRGRARGIVGGAAVEAGAGETVLVPPNTPHTWWNEDDEPAEAILIFFGDGA